MDWDAAVAVDRATAKRAAAERADADRDDAAMWETAATFQMTTGVPVSRVCGVVSGGGWIQADSGTEFISLHDS